MSVVPLRILHLRRSLAAALIAAIALSSLSGCDLSRITGSTESGVWSAGTSTHEVVVVGIPRTFQIHVPPKRLTRNSLPASWPLVIVLHGSGAEGTDIEQATAMDSVADANLFVVAYPDGSRGEFGVFPSDWNAGSCCGGAHRDNIDDIAFLRQMIATVSRKLTIDAHRTYVAGFSAGARMAYHVGCQMSSSIAAIAAVSGSLVDESCKPAFTVPLIAVHGTADEQVDYHEDAPTFPRPAPPLANSATPAAQFWTALGKCTTGKTTQPSTHVSLLTFTVCTNTEVQFYSIDGGTHGWPGGRVEPGSLAPMSELRMSALVWQFFNRKTR